MPTTKRKCRVCGRVYEACRTTQRASGGFNWREVACSPECGEKYLHSVMVARGAIADTSKEETARKNKGKNGKKNSQFVAETPDVIDDAIGEEAPAVSVDAADDTVADYADTEE